VLEATEAPKVRQQQTDQGAENVAALKLELELELEKLDREWAEEERRHMVRGRFGSLQPPTKAHGVVQLVASVAIGIGVIYCDLAEVVGEVTGVLTLFGIVFIVVGIAFCAYSCARAGEYNRANESYERRRSEIVQKIMNADSTLLPQEKRADPRNEDDQPAG
jgi:hypothetical protein